MSIQNFKDWNKTYVPSKRTIVNEGLLSRLLGDDLTLGKVCEKIRGSIGELGSFEQDSIMVQLEKRFGKALVLAIDNGWTNEDFEKHKDQPAVQNLMSKVDEINDWVDSNLM